MNYLKRLFYLFKSTKKENFTSIIEDLEHIKQSIENISDEVVSDKNFSLYRLDLLTRKICLLMGKQTDCMYDYSFYIRNLNELNHMMPKLIWLITLLVAILFLFSLLPLQILLVCVQIYFFVTVRDNIKNAKSKEKDIEILYRSINNTTTTCNNFINKRINTHIDALHEEKNCTVEVLANEFISHYIDHEVICKTSKEVMDYAINILRYELQSNETDIKVLLEKAQERISEDSLQEELVRSRNKDFK